MDLFFSTPIWVSKIENYKKVNEDMLAYILESVAKKCLDIEEFIKRKTQNLMN